MSAQKEEIVWDVDWDELDPVTQVEHPMDLSTPTRGANVDASPPPARPGVSVAQPAPVLSPPLPPPPLPSSTDPSLNPGPAAKHLVRGERFDLESILAQKPQIAIELIASNSTTLKLICLGLDAAEKITAPAYCVGPRQPNSPCGGISHETRRDGRQAILVRAAMLAPSIKRLEVSVVAAVSGTALGDSVEGFRLLAGDQVLAESMHLDSACAGSSCATLVEIYERQGTWRMRMIGDVLAPSIYALLAKHGAKAG